VTDDPETRSMPPSAGSSVPPEPASLQFRPGDRVGNYVIREQIGEGGFAIVYAAEQEKPVRRKVALKIIKPGVDTRQVIDYGRSVRTPLDTRLGAVIAYSNADDGSSRGQAGGVYHGCGSHRSPDQRGQRRRSETVSVSQGPTGSGSLRTAVGRCGGRGGDSRTGCFRSGGAACLALHSDCA